MSARVWLYLLVGWCHDDVVGVVGSCVGLGVGLGGAWGDVIRGDDKKCEGR